MEQAQRSWMGKAPAWPRKGLTGSIALVRKCCKRLKIRYGPRYTCVMVSAAFFTFFLPIPGVVMVSVGLIMVIAESHRAISKSGGFYGMIATWFVRAAGIYPRKLVMSNNCDVIVQWSATTQQLKALGTALWRWCNRPAANTGIYRYLDNQALADLIDGKLPPTSQTDPRGFHLWVRDEASRGRQGTIDSLRREIPSKGVADLLVDGQSWT